MTGHVDSERILAAFLAPEHDQLAERVLEASFTDIARTPQRPAPRWRWKLRPRAQWLGPIAAAGAAAVLVGAGLLAVGAGRGDVTPTPSVPPSSTTVPQPPSPDRLLDTTTWLPFEASRYGYTARYPSGWTPTAGTRDIFWDHENKVVNTVWMDTFTDLREGQPQIVISAFSAVPLAVDETLDEFTQGLLDGPWSVDASPCSTIVDAVPMAIDGNAGRMASTDCSGPEAFTIVDRRVYIFSLWGSSDRRLLEAFVSTVRINRIP